MKKLQVIASVHEGAVWQMKHKQLEAAIADAYSLILPAPKLTIVWQRLPAGQAYLAGEPSTTSTVVVPVPNDISPAQREQFMNAVCQEWMRITDCSVDEIIVNAMSEDYLSRYTALSKSRLSKKRVKARYFGMLLAALVKKPFRGYLSFNINLRS